MSSDEEEGSDWERCVAWLHRCMILSQEQRDMIDCVDHLAMFLRDGVMLCLLLNRLHPGAVDPRSFSQRPQMSQFLCLKNIRVFLLSCKKVFGMKDSALFEASNLFEVQDFKKVVDALSTLSNTKEAKKSGIEPFSTETDEEYVIFAIDSQEDNIYSEHIYGNSTEDADEDVYGQLIDYQPKTLSVAGRMSPRDHCIKEILDTERKYVDVLNMIMEKFHDPLKSVLPGDECQVIFRNISDLRTIHRNILSDLALVKCAPGTTPVWTSADKTIPGCFVKHKMKLVIYGDYCANLQAAQEQLDRCLKRQQVRDIVEAKSEEAKVKLRDVLVVPFQRVLKYHLLIDQLKKVTEDQSKEKPVIEHAFEEMQDVSMYVNEVKRDSENLALISEIESSISDLGKYMQSGNRLQQYGRRLHDGDVKIKSPRDRAFENRYAFLLDKVLIICRPKGDTYSYKDVLVLSNYEFEEHPQEKNLSCFKLVESVAADGAAAKTYIFGVKSVDQKEKWRASIMLGKSNVSPDGCDLGEFRFRMFTVEQPTICDVCKKLLKGVFFQGYRCQNTGLTVHKECIKKAIAVKDIKPNTKVKATAEYNGHPEPPTRGQQPLLFGFGDVIIVEKISGDWIKGRLNDKVGFFPLEKVRVLAAPARQGYEEPVGPSVPSNGLQRPPAPRPPVKPQPRAPPESAPQNPVLKPRTPNKERSRDRVESSGATSNRQKPDVTQLWFAGPISRPVATEILQNTRTGTFLIRYGPEKQEYALSISDTDCKDKVRHLKIHKDDRGYCLAQVTAFEDLGKLVEYYTSNSLQESFPNVKTCLMTPYQQAKKTTVNEPGVAGYCIALHDYDATEPSQLSFSVDDRIAIISKTSIYPLWWKCKLNGRIGIIPSNYVREL